MSQPTDSRSRPLINQEVIALYDEYTHAPLPRRVFMKRLSSLAGGSVAAAALLPLLENNYARAAVIAPDAPGLSAGEVEFRGAGMNVCAYLARPAAQGRYPAVLVIHENRGRNPHIEDIARRLAQAGFMALAPDYLSGQGGTPADEDKARSMIATLKPEEVDAISRDAVAWLGVHSASNSLVGAMGFCWGGGAANRLATQAPDLKAAVVFYGMQPAADTARHIRAAMQLHYAGLDTRINAGIPAYEAALAKAGVAHEIHVYDGVNHAFNNDTNAARYDAAAATLAWERSLAFLHRYLS